jgi:hypothetical protein
MSCGESRPRKIRMSEIFSMKMPTVAEIVQTKLGPISASLPRPIMMLKEDGKRGMAYVVWQAKCRLERGAGVAPHASPAMPISQ